MAYVYNPLAYAFAPHRAYLERYGLQPMRFTRVRAIELETGAVREDGVLWLEHQEEA